MLRFFWLILFFLTVVYGQDGSPAKNISKSGRKSVKGEQFVRQSVVARIKNGPIPQSVLNLLLENSTQTDDVPDEDSRVTPMLITDNVKTVITRVEIPLSTIYMDSDWYRTTLRKFLIQNKIDVTNSSMIESPDGALPAYEHILSKLDASVRLRSNLLTTFGLLLQNTKAVKLLPPDHHPALSIIYQLLKLRRISVFGMLENMEKLYAKKNVDTYIAVFSELWETVPKFAMSCPTLWLESLQEGTIVNEYFLSLFLPKGNLISGLPENDASVQTPLLFPKQLLQTFFRDHELLFGKTLAGILSGVMQGVFPLRAPFFTTLLLHLPLNTPAFEGIDVTTFLEISEEEDNYFQQVMQELRPSFLKAPLIEIFKIVLSKILKIQSFDGRKKYELFQKSLEAPSEDFMFYQFSSSSGATEP